MRFLILLSLLPALVFGQQLNWKTVNLEVNTNCRGLSVVNDSVAWISGTGGWVGNTNDGGKEWNLYQVKGFEKFDFRSLYAFDNDHAVIANAGSPAAILITKDGGRQWKIVHTDSDTTAFYDGIDFWNKKDGIIYGDPVNGRMMLLTTNDGGQNWQMVPAKNRPQLSVGEASFAASGTGIRCIEKQKIILATGGKISSLLISPDKGKHWKRIETPIIQGQNSTGIFSVASISNKQYIIVGGNYLIDTFKTDHIFYTKNGGKSWLKPLSPTRGYRECVEYLGKKTLISTGPSGADISYDNGITWLPFNDEKNFHTIRKARSGKLILATGKGKIAIISH